MVLPEQQTGEKQPNEVERKFLVSQTPENLNDYEHEQIRQGYLVVGADGSEARLRERGDRYTITVKSRGDLSRGEWETAISKDQFEELWPATAGKRIEKTRYVIPYEDVMIELDIYEGDLRGLVTAEVEFSDKATAHTFIAPKWLDQEVTTDKRFKNQELALNGLPV